MAKNKGGRPCKLTKELVNKLEQCFALDTTIKEACFYCDISRESFYTYKENNPEMFDRLERLRQQPVLKARQEVVKGIENDKEFALKYLTKKAKSEFGDKLELSGEVDFSYKLKVVDDRPNAD